MKLAIVVPCYNEEEVLHETSKRLLYLLEKLIKSDKINSRSEIYFVDDGSKDETWRIINELTATHQAFRGIKLSRNRGHQNALLAGLFSVEADATISIDADLQDDVNAIEEMVDAFLDGSDVVYGVRKRRESDTFFKRSTAEGFYTFMKFLGVDIVYNHADYRLLSKRAVEELKGFKEVNLFLRGVVPLIGFQSSVVYYDRDKRFAGESKYPLKKMLSFALDGVTSLSVSPLRFITVTGFIIFLISLVMIFWVLSIKLFTQDAISGWASTVLPIYFIGGIQLFSLGIVGEYVGKIYLESKARPKYIIEKVI